MGEEFRIVPVVDLRHGLAVRARAGERASYAPIATPLAKGSAPEDVARGLIAATGADILYLADLDAIMDEVPPDLALLRRVASACPGVTLWVDAGFATMEGVAAFLDSGSGRPVIGSESQRDGRLVRELGDRAVLSLDTRAGARLGPDILHDDPGLWPGSVIAMSLDRVGIGAGPDLARLRDLRARRPGVQLYAAGGVRGPEDVRVLEESGVAGALVASAIHDGRLGRAKAEGAA
ncbi:HisA/HisF-related TIM barrel protein [Methylobacterium iners]|uniref:1-(5-phosphoribosyl)-5-[(5-phosphoribosylamino) methylideneamino] imidazole-4-carboxamide isomerase n=1 Tax=Methylobacterium iners TaxID=418707 RepID=A0ABQ4S6U0_9HYPH|nr:HisA/HisF-related TIM barrel protein [Methylobacterium iners]GJD97395.1 1-(5-phosphoribosyl)-5-[(5-phosphoribosylamino) methylideneamino] imidazole-4-carboxamide isomerase [Methylobacterium iners]